MAGPSGTVTFLFTDIVDSTRSWETAPKAMEQALAAHDAIVRDGVESHGGTVFAATGDGFAVAFDRASDALAAAVWVQHRLQSEQWPEPLHVQIRAGVHTGEAQEREGNYFGPTVNRAARLMTAATGSQILVSGTTAEVIGRRSDIELVPLGDRKLRGLTEPIVLFAVRGDGLVEDAPPQERRGNLPVVTTPFVGQQAEFSMLREKLASSRLVTLTGAGGIGKTRLAVEVARSIVDDFADGAWLVELAPIADSDAVLPAITTLLGVPTGGGSLLEALIDWMHGRQMLVVIDNAEHVLAAVVELAAALVRGAPTISVLVTSREPLGVHGEQVLPMRTLDPGTEGVELFENTARAADAGVAFVAADRESIDAICRRLDGIPLAIELAAARCRSMRPTEILARLDDRFALLRRSAPGAIDRHQTLISTVTWSYQLLSKQEQRMFNRVSVFAGGFTLEAAESVCAAHPVSRHDVVDLISALVEKSMLLTPRGRDSDQTRYTQLETLRQYGERCLVEDGEVDSVRDTHAAFYTDLAMRRAQATVATGEPDRAWLSCEWENLRAAHARTIATRDADRAALLVIAVDENTPDQLGFDCKSMAYSTLELIGEQHPAARSLWSIAARGHLAAGDYDSVFAATGRVRALPPTLDPEWRRCDERAAFMSILVEAGAFLQLGRHDDAVAATAELARHTDGEPHREFYLRYMRIGIAMGHDPERMPSLAEELETSARAFPSSSRLIHATAALGRGMAAMDRGDMTTARAEFEQDRELVRGTHGVRELEALSLIAFAAAGVHAADAEVAFSEAVFEHYDRRFWSYLWILIQNLAMYWSGVDKRDQAAVLIGYLHCHGLAHAMWSGPFEAVTQDLLADPAVDEYISQGEAMNRDELVRWTLDELPPIAI